MSENSENREAPRSSPLLRLLKWTVLVVVLLGLVGTGVFLYMANKDSSFVDKTVNSLNEKADSLDGKDSDFAAAKLREFGAFLRKHKGEIGEYGSELDEKLSAIKEHSQEAYEAAKKKLEEYKEKK
jgi:type VI protein secretion system component VasK